VKTNNNLKLRRLIVPIWLKNNDYLFKVTYESNINCTLNNNIQIQIFDEFNNCSSNVSKPIYSGNCTNAYEEKRIRLRACHAAIERNKLPCDIEGQI